MSSFRTLFFITLTLFAALTWAVPVKGPNSAALSQHSDSVNGATILDLEVMDFQEHHQTHHRNTHQSLRRDIPSLCEVLVEVGQKLAVVSNKMTEATKKADKVDVNLVVQLTSEVEAILSGTAANVKALVGRPMEFILLLHGKTQSKAEASSLLVNVINLVCAILARAARFAAAASAKVIINAGSAFGDFLSTTFNLVEGLHVAARHHLNSAISICTKLNLTTVVAVLYGQY